MTPDRFWKDRIRAKASALGRQLDADVVEELALHAAAAFDAERMRGASDDAAESSVSALLAAWVSHPETLQGPPKTPLAPPPPVASSSLVSGLSRDVHYGVRVLSRQRGFAGLAIFTLALAIAIATTLFSVLDAVLLRPLPWPDPDRLVRLTETHTGATRQIPLAVTNLAARSWTDPLTTIEDVGFWSGDVVAMTTNSGTARVQAARVTPGVFAMLKAAPMHGHLFTSDTAPEVVVSFGLWREQFGASLDALGQIVRLGGQAFTIVGVMPASFSFPDRETRLWRPMQIPAAPAMTTVRAMARLRAGVTPDQAATEATARASTMSTSPNSLMMLFGTTGPVQILAEPALDALTHDVRPALVAMFAAVSLLFVAAVANIAGLQLARATTRVREMAIRSALGAGTGRLVRQLLVEQLLLAAAGGMTGIALAAGLHRLLPTVLPPDFPRLSDIGMNVWVIVFAAGLSMATGVALGVLPALRLRRLRLAPALTETSGGSIGGTRGRARAYLMTGQIAIACLLFVGALLLGRSFVAMLSQDRGFDSAHLLTARLNLPNAQTPDERIETVETFVDRAAALPGAPTVAVTTGLPLSGSENLSGFDMPSVRPPAGVTINVHAVRSVVTANYIDALGLRLIAGRSFQAGDDSSAAPKVVIVNRTFARQYLTDGALGDHIRNFMNGDGVDFEVIGVVEDMRRRGLTDTVQPEIYSLLRQSPRPSAAQDLVVRTTQDPLRLADPLRQLTRQVAPSGTLDSVRTMDDRILGSLVRPRLYAIVLVIFAVSAVVIACVGLGGVLSYSVAQRRREIALRLALGAEPMQVLGAVLRQGLAMTAIGVASGLTAAYLTARFLSTLVYGISMHDAVSFVGGPFVLGVAAIGACITPAWRAMTIDPSVTLRQ